MIGLDTGFFVKLLEGDKKAISIWNSLVNDSEEAVISCLTLFELERLSLKGKIAREGIDIVFEAINTVCLVNWLDNREVLAFAAKLSNSIGLHATDSLILSGFLISGANTIYTTDSDMESYRKKGVKIVNLYVNTENG